MYYCKNCGFPFEGGAVQVCPKCQMDWVRQGSGGVMEIDVVHSGETWEMAREAIVRGLDQAIYGQYKGLRVIHGYGSLGGEAVIAPQAISLMRHLAEQNDARFAKDNKNPGVSIIWLNRTRTKGEKGSNEQLYFHKDSIEKDTFGGDWFELAQKKKY